MLIWLKCRIFAVYVSVCLGLRVSVKVSRLVGMARGRRWLIQSMNVLIKIEEQGYVCVGFLPEFSCANSVSLKRISFSFIFRAVAQAHIIYQKKPFQKINVKKNKNKKRY